VRVGLAREGVGLVLEGVGVRVLVGLVREAVRVREGVREGNRVGVGVGVPMNTKVAELKKKETLSLFTILISTGPALMNGKGN